MELRNERPVETEETDKETTRIGTIFSVGVVGMVILLMWIGIFWLYMSRV